MADGAQVHHLTQLKLTGPRRGKDEIISGVFSKHSIIACMQSSGQCKKSKKILITPKEMSCSPIYHHALGPNSIKIKSSHRKVRFTLSRSDHFIISPPHLPSAVYLFTFNVSSSHEKKEVNGPANCCYRFLSHDSPKASKKKTQNQLNISFCGSLIILLCCCLRSSPELRWRQCHLPSLSLERAFVVFL